MNTAEYKDEISTLRDAIGHFKACVNFAERVAEAERLQRAWKRLAMIEQPKRLPSQYRERCDRVLNQAAEVLNKWHIEFCAGPPESESCPAPPAKAMADTLRFCRNTKPFGF
jgi:hypothetical protein